MMKNRGTRCGPFAKTAICIALAGGVPALLPVARADAISDLKAQMGALQQRVNELEAAQRAAAKEPTVPGNVVTGGATPGSFKLPRSDTSVKIGGYIKGDAIYSSRSAGVNSSADQELEPGNIPLSGDNEKKQLTVHARQSRLNVRTDTPTRLGGLTTFLEVDLFGASGNESVSNSHNLRVRHAYGSLGGLLVGQTWSNFMDPGALPEVLDFGGPVGEMFVRQTQVRWTQALSAGSWSVALENPETVVSQANGTGLRADDDRFPDLTGKLEFRTRMGRYAVTGLVRQIRIDTAAIRHSKWGGAVGLSGVVPSRGKDEFRFSANYGNVLGRYTAGFFTDGIIQGNGELDLPNTWAAQASYRHFWTDALRSSLVLGGLRASNGLGAAGTLNRSAQSAHLNLIWTPVKNTDLGFEYIYARREIEDGRSGVLNRVQASAQFSF
jgi:hypothetical protein